MVVAAIMLEEGEEVELEQQVEVGLPFNFLHMLLGMSKNSAPVFVFESTSVNCLTFHLFLPNQRFSSRDVSSSSD